MKTKRENIIVRRQSMHSQNLALTANQQIKYNKLQNVMVTQNVITFNSKCRGCL